MVNNVQAKLKLLRGKNGGWNERAMEELAALLAKPPRQRARVDDLAPAPPVLGICDAGAPAPALEDGRSSNDALPAPGPAPAEAPERPEKDEGA
eukprot:7095014-Alexandrium_andersonii.AAC.1